MNQQQRDALVLSCRSMVGNLAWWFLRRNPTILVAYSYDDIKQEIWATVLRSADKYEIGKGAKFTTYMYNYIRWNLTNFARVFYLKRAHDMTSQPLDPTCNELALSRREEWDVDPVPALCELSTRTQSVIVRHNVCGETFDTIGEQMGFTKQRAEQIERRGLEKVRAKLLEGDAT